MTILQRESRETKQLCKRRSRGGFKKLAWEGFRWLSPWVFLILVVVSAVFFLLDTCSDEYLLVEWQSGKSLHGDAIYYLTGSVAQLQNVGLCCAIFAGAGLYAQDYEENAVYMRIQRMGARRYAGLRTMQVSIASWLVGCIGMLFAVLLVSLVLQVPLFPRDPGSVESWTRSRLLQSGRNMEFLATLVFLAGFRSMFYSVVTFVFSFFVPRRRVLLALPMLLWYFNQHVLVWVEWIPLWLQPRIVFDLSGVQEFGGISEWGRIWRVAVGMVCLAVAVWAVFVLRLRRTGIFGGEQVE